jgi:phenylalanyl-tRNA synthetase beta chain
MKISLQWLADYLPGALDAQTAAEALTNGGLPVEVIEKHGDDTVIDVEVTSNRGDCLSHVGVARELSALLARPFKDVAPSAPASKTSADILTKVAIEKVDLCPHYTARVLRNVRIQPSPPWLSKRLEAVGLRPINNVVDVTNYVMLEMGQPLHAFDFDKLAGREIVVRTARPGEKLMSIDGHERKLAESMLVIADAERPVAIAGIMGGLDTEVSDQTTSVLLESARFDPLSVRRTSRTLALKSESSYRFERGIDPKLALCASLRAAQLILETAGGELASGVVQAGDDAEPAVILSLRPGKLKQLLGVDLPTSDVIDALTRLGLSPSAKEDRIECRIPSYRRDLRLEVDLIEEVVRVIGYQHIPMRDEISIRVMPPELSLRTIDKIRQTLVSAGYFEAVTFSFVSDSLAGFFLPDGAQSLPRADSAVRKADAHLRPSILPGLLQALRHNQSNGIDGAKLFEIGSTFYFDGAGRLLERRRIGLVGSADVHEVRGAVEAILAGLNQDHSIQLPPADHRGYMRGASANLNWGDQIIGELGVIDRAVVDKLSLQEQPAVAEIDLEPLLAGAEHVPQLHPLPRFPAVRRDLSFILPESTRFERLEHLVRKTGDNTMEALEYVTTYRGKPLEKGTKSVTITLVFRSPAQTLTSESVESAVRAIVQAAENDLGAKLRT